MVKRESWHLDKKFPVALIVTLMIQSGAAVWFAAKISFQVQLNKDLLEMHKVGGPHEDVDKRLSLNTQKIDQVLEELRALKNVLYAGQGR